MINVNGELLPKGSENIGVENRGFKYADSVFETLKVYKGKILYWEDHYFRLMSSMRIMRMEIPMNFTMEFLETEILRTIGSTNNQPLSARVRLSVNRTGGGLYRPETNDIDYVITFSKSDDNLYYSHLESYTVDLFKDYFINPGLLSNIKKSDKTLNILGSIYAEENDFDNCLILNSDKNLVEALNGNLFLVFGDHIKTPALDQGCVKGILRKQLLEMLKRDPNYTIEETSISPFELQRADETFITNVIMGIQSITNYRKKVFQQNTATYLIEELNKRMEA